MRTLLAPLRLLLARLRLLIKPDEHTTPWGLSPPQRLAFGMLLLVLGLPWLLAPWPVGTDLAQHAAQVELLRRAIGGDAVLGVSWWAPNSLVYWLLAPPVWVLGPVAGVKLLSWGLVAASTGLGAWLCHMRKASAELSLLAAIFCFNSTLYWGFLPFQLGWVAFLAWLIAMLSPQDNDARHLALLAVLSAVVLWSHSLWFGAAGIAGVACTLVRPGVWRQRVVRGLPAIPAALWASWWVPRMSSERAARGFDMEARWFVEGAARFKADFFGTGVFGHILGDYVEVMGGLCMAAVLLLAHIRRDERERGADRELLAIAALMLLAFAKFPDKYVNTIEFARRWAPYACAMAVLGGIHRLMPTWRQLNDRVPRPAAWLIALPLLVALTWTGTTWRAMSHQELSGLDEALALVGELEEPRTVGLNHIPHSRFVRGAPYIQQFAWAQALHGGTLNFSFTEHGSGIVYELNPRPHSWTGGLEWMPERFSGRDLQYFDVVLLGGAQEHHARLAAMPGIKPLTTSGMWRAYKITPTR